MAKQPPGDALLVCARRVLVEEILPNVPPEKKHALLMAVNAISIVDRQLCYGAGAATTELNEFRSLTGEPFADLTSAGKKLAHFIREGMADPLAPARRQVYQSLLKCVLLRVRQSNPKALQRFDKEI